MATNVQRATALLKALQDGPVSAANYDRVMRAFALNHRPDQDQATMTAEDQAELLLTVLGGLVVQTVNGVELRELQERARLELRPFILLKEKQT
jgi:hypothetical protein